MTKTGRTGYRFAITCLILVVLSTCGLGADQQPNVVLIMTDNHGAWTLGCYGNQEIRTPSIDRLASEGILFTRAFASNPVCSPTRATFLTGLLPSQHGVHSFLSGGRLQIGPKARCTLDEFTSLPEVLSQAGYTCGLVGKWHLGDNLEPQEDFNGYWVTMPHGATRTFYNAKVIENGKIRNEPQATFRQTRPQTTWSATTTSCPPCCRTLILKTGCPANQSHPVGALRVCSMDKRYLYADSTLFTTRDRLKRKLDEFFANNSQPKYDMWHGGGSQTRIFLGINEVQARP